MCCHWLIVECSGCGGEGRIYQRETYFCRHTGYHEGDVDVGPCEPCEGTGGEIIATQPIELGDLDAMSGGAG